MKQVEFCHIGKTFYRDLGGWLSSKREETEVLSNFHMKIEPGEFLVLVGPSGCGKSTALRILAGLENPTSGEVRIGEQKVNDLPAHQRGVGMVFQSYALYPHMTVEENLSFGLRMMGKKEEDYRELLLQTAKELELEELLSRKPKELSGGQRQRVALGRAMVRQPQVLLMDEPLSNLDAKLRVKMRRELKKIHQQRPTTTLYVTHDQVEAMTLGDRIAVLHEGKIQQVGTPTELYHSPCNLFVAKFLGTPPINIFSGVCRSLEEKLFFYPLSSKESSWSLDLEHSVGEEEIDREVDLGIRPGDFTPSCEGVGLDMKILSVENLGSTLWLHGSWNRFMITIECGVEEREKMPEVGETLWFKPDPAKALLFDRKSGHRLSLKKL